MSSIHSIEPLADAFADALVEAASGLGLGIVEGRVRGATARYRRLDCDGRALAYLRPRRRPPHGVRVDLSGLWQRPGPSRLEIAGRTGAASLFVADERDAVEAARYLAWAVANMRALLAREQARRSLRAIESQRSPG